METAYAEVRSHLQRAAERRKRTYDLRVRPVKFKEGDLVWLYTPRRYQGRSPKWGKNYTGPFQIIRAYGQVNYVLRKSTRTVPFVAHVDKLKLCLNQDLSAEVAREDDPGVAGKMTNELESDVLRDDESRNRPRRFTKRPARYSNGSGGRSRP
jgi:hypothetical protein